MKEQFDMTHDEIAVVLSIPKTRVTNAIEIYGHLPSEMRDRVKFMGKGGPKRNGAIPASVATQILSMRQTYKLDKATISRMLNDTRTHHLTKGDLQIVGHLMKSGATPDKAMTLKDKYQDYNLMIIADCDDIKTKSQNAKMRPVQYLESIIYGESKPLTRPDFVN